jgi:hypothetical protein
MNWDYEVIRTALFYIPAHDRDTWLRMGMAIKSELGEDGFPLWDEWSQTAGNYNAKGNKAVWKSIKPNGGITIASLFYEAKGCGFQPDQPIQPPSPEEAERSREQREAEARKREEQEARRRAEAAARAKAIWESAQAALDTYPYLVRKGVKSHGLKLYRGDLVIDGMPCDGALLVPIQDIDGALYSLAFISPEERRDDKGNPDNKRFLPKGQKAENFFLVGSPGDVICTTEGYADTASLFEASGYASAVAFDVGNILAVVKALRSRYSDARILACLDNDAAGRKAGESLAGIENVAVIYPPEGFKDFNDFYRGKGLEAVRWWLKAKEKTPIYTLPEPPSLPEAAPWPVLDKAALTGLVGDIVRAATENSEADPAAVLMTALVWEAATLGTGPYLLIGDTLHYARLFSVLVGASSRARKGTSLAPVQRLFEAIYQYVRRKSTLPFPGGLKLRVTHGPPSSGEGLVYAVRDPVEQEDKKGKLEVIDPSVEDKRLLVIEGEFSAVLKACQREGNTLSAILRTAWDHGNVEPLTKHNRTKATGAHINFVGHITEYELRSLLTSVDVWNGFANRILWGAVRRTQRIPFPQPMADGVVSSLSVRLGEVFIRAWSRGRVDLHPEAAQVWKATYETLTEDKPGVLGAVTSRAEAQTLRLALLYSLLDPKATLIEAVHLKAALAVWAFCEQSARYLFGEASIEPEANVILKALAGGEKTQTEISGLFSRNLPKEKLRDLLSQLQAQGRITCRQEDGGNGARRATTFWKLANLRN